MSETLENFADFLTEHGAVDLEEIQTEDLVRITVVGDRGDQQSGTYKLFMNLGKGVPSGYMNNYRTDKYEKWSGKAVEGTKNISSADLQKRKEEKQLAKDALQRTKFRQFKKEWDSLKSAGPSHPYAMNKGLNASFFKRANIRSDERNNLVMPIKNKQGKITNLQRIWSNGKKQLEKDGQLAGSFVEIAGSTDTNYILVAEGVSTAAPINDITGIQTYASLTSNNLTNVAKVVQEMHPDKTIIIAGDNDYHLELRDVPMKNAGMIAATKAAEEVNGKAVFPPFSMAELAAGRTDWNDYYQDKGFAKTRDSLRTAFQRFVDVKVGSPTKEARQEMEID